MPKEIIWSPLAESDVIQVIDFLEKNWTVNIAVKFLDKIDASIFLISRDYDLFPLINKELGIRKCVISKHNSLYYREINDKIEIIRLFDTRQDPKNLRLE